MTDEVEGALSQICPRCGQEHWALHICPTIPNSIRQELLQELLEEDYLKVPRKVLEGLVDVIEVAIGGVIDEMTWEQICLSDAAKPWLVAARNLLKE